MSDPDRPDALARDPVLDAAWNTHSTELPPARIDAAILAAAHRESRTRPHAVGDDDGSTHARGPARAWWGLAAAAAIGVIAFGVIQMAPPAIEKPEPMVASDIPSAPAAAAPAPAGAAATQPAEVPSTPPSAETGGRVATSRSDAPPPAQSSRNASNARGEAKVAKPEARVAPGEVSRPQAGAAQNPASASAVPEPQRQRIAAAERSRDAGADALQRSARAPDEPQVGAMAPPAVPAPSPPQPVPAPPPSFAYAPPASSAPSGAGPVMRAQRAAPSQPLAKRAVAPDAWIERISALHAQQRFDEAARELNAFREAHPDADKQLPAHLVAWAASVKPRP